MAAAHARRAGPAGPGGGPVLGVLGFLGQDQLSLLAERGVEQADGGLVGVEFGRDAEREGLERPAVADVGPGEHRDGGRGSGELVTAGLERGADLG